MNDPHVESLHYSIKHDVSIAYEKAPPLSYDGPDFSVRVEGGRADVAMRVHCANAEEARRLVEPFLRAWELAAALERNPGEFELEYENAKVIDRKPPPGYVDHLETAAFVVTGGSVEFRLNRASYPPPTTSMLRNSVTDSMFECFCRYREGRRTLADAGYFCLTIAEREAGDRPSAAQRFAIDIDVLRKIGELTANKGGEDARKAGGANVDYTDREKQWIDAAMKALIRRAAEVAHDAHAERPVMTMADLPGL